MLLSLSYRKEHTEPSDRREVKTHTRLRLTPSKHDASPAPFLVPGSLSTPVQLFPGRLYRFGEHR